MSSFGIKEEHLREENLEGHYGNSLVSAKAHIVGESATMIARAVLSRLGNASKMILLAQLDRYLDEHDALYLRLDRQGIPEQLLLTDDEPIRIKLKPRFRIRDRKTMLGEYARLIQT